MLAGLDRHLPLLDLYLAFAAHPVATAGRRNINAGIGGGSQQILVGLNGDRDVVGQELDLQAHIFLRNKPASQPVMSDVSRTTECHPGLAGAGFLNIAGVWSLSSILGAGIVDRL